MHRRELRLTLPRCVAQTIINSAKIEVDCIRALRGETGAKPSRFFRAELPAAKPAKTMGANGRDKPQVMRTQ
ncbi:MAG: hypothetical protein ACLP1Y_09350 [Candidatus Acidiferrales bacterium]